MERVFQSAGKTIAVGILMLAVGLAVGYHLGSRSVAGIQVWTETAGYSSSTEAEREELMYSDTESLSVEADSGETSASIESTGINSAPAEPEPVEAQTEKININTASAAQLEELPGIGEKRAAAIIAERETSGSFRTVEDITRVNGIGEGVFEDIRTLITVE